MVENHHYCVTIGYFPDGRCGEVFLAEPRVGSQLAAILADSAILASKCLQGGMPADELARSMSRLPTCDGQAKVPASPIGAALDLAAKL